MLPMGHPMVMMGFTAEGQLADSLVTRRDQRFNVSTSKKKQNRADIPTPSPLPGADAWQQGEIRQLTITHDAKAAGNHH